MYAACRCFGNGDLTFKVNTVYFSLCASADPCKLCSNMCASATLSKDRSKVSIVCKLRCVWRNLPKSRAYAVPCPGLSEKFHFYSFQTVFIEFAGDIG